MEMITSARVIRDDRDQFLIDCNQALPVSSIAGIRRDDDRIVLLGSDGEEYGLFSDLPAGAAVSLTGPDVDLEGRRVETRQLKWH